MLLGPQINNIPDESLVIVLFTACNENNQKNLTNSRLFSIGNHTVSICN